MPGIFGTSTAETDLSEMIDASHRTAGNEDDIHEADPFGLALRHQGESDPGGHAWWSDGERAGAIYGAVVNREDLGWSVADLFERVLDDPSETLPALDGPFVLAAFDAGADRYVLGTDKLGTRTLYYRTDGGLRFGSELHPLVTGDDEVDVRAVSDMLFLGNVWGEKTLVEGVASLPPATYLAYEADEATAVKYWKPNLDPARPGRTYLTDLASAYRTAVEASAETLSGSVGLFLSGGLDSRSMAAELHRNAERGAFDSLKAFTYDSNPPGAGNPKIAGRVADVVDADISELRQSAESFLDVLDEAVSRTDGMANWDYLISPATMFQIPERDRCPTLEACGQGELLGELPYRYHLTDCSVSEAFRKTDAGTDPDRVRDVLADDVDPFETFRTLATRSDETGRRRTILDIHYENHYARGHMASTKLYRSAVGSRIPFAHREFLECVTRLPSEYRLGTLPYSDGRVPYAVSKPKIGLIRLLSSELAAVPYERTLVGPNRSYAAHTGGYGVNKLQEKTKRLLDPNPPGPATWYRTDPDFRSRIDQLLDSAANREFVDERAVRRLQQGRPRKGDMWLIGSLTTLELWLRRHLDAPVSDEAGVSRVRS